MFPIEQPYKVYTDLDGSPLENGDVYIGIANQNPITAPITVYWDEAGTQPAAQPLRTINGYIVRAGTPSNIYCDVAYSILVQDKRGRQVFYARDSDSFSVVGVIVNFLANLALSSGAALIGFIQEGVGAVLRTLESKERDTANLFDFMTEAQIDDYVARTADTNFAGALDLTAVIQQAVYTTYAQNKTLHQSPGAAKVTGTIEIPTNSALYEDRGDAWSWIGSGSAQNFVRTLFKGASIISKTDAPILRYHQRRALPTSGANYEVTGLRFEQLDPLAAQPVVLLDSLAEYARFHHNQVFQGGVGDAMEVSCQVKGEIHHNFFMNRDWLTAVGVKVGTGVKIVSGWDSGLLTLRKNSARGFLWGYIIGDGTNDSSGTLLEQNEVSNCNNGVWIKPNTTACTLFKPYFEGVTGICVKDEGTMTVVDGGMFYFGFSTGIQSLSTTYGNRYTGNYLETNGDIPCTLIDIASSGANGGPAKTVTGNHLLFSTSGGVVPGVRGVRINGLDPRIDFHGNAFDPRGPWIGGASTIKVDDQSTGNLYGFSTVSNDAKEFPYLGQGAISLGLGNTITETDVSANTLNLPLGSYFEVTASVATSINIVAGGNADNRLIVLRTTNANTTFNDTAQLLLSAAFTGPGMLVLMTQNVGATKYAYEVSRTVY